MGTTVEGLAVRNGGWRRRHSALRLGDDAARECLQRAGRRARDIDLLLNVGIYRDRNLGEPALAALIQEDIGANPEDPHPGGHGTFSFDVANGACGVLTALQVADGFLRAGTIAHALVVASDADPGHRMSAAFPFAPTGGALLCGWTDDQRGLDGFRWATKTATSDLFSATVSFERGGNRLSIDRASNFADVAIHWAAEVARDLLAEHGLGPVDVDLVVTNPIHPSCASTFARLMDLDEGRVVCAGGEPPGHTSGLIASLAAAEAGGQMGNGNRILLVTAGAGVAAGAALLQT